MANAEINMSGLSGCAVVTICLTIALAYTCSALTKTHIQVDCGYTPAFTIQYIDELFLSVFSVAGLLSFGTLSKEEARRMLPSTLRWALFFSPLGLAANVSFTAALRLTSTSSALILEQLTSLFIAVLSFIFLEARYSLVSMFLLLVAVGGAMLGVLGDAVPGAAGQAPLLGDMLSLVVALLAGLYMVLFKIIFPSMTTSEFLYFFVLKGMVTVGVGWIGIVVFDMLGWEKFALPNGGSSLWVLLGAAVSAMFNWSLMWGTLRISPLTARLSLLLGIPCSFLVDIFTGEHKSVRSWIGVILVLGGVVGFELTFPQRRAGNAESLPPATACGVTLSSSDSSDQA